MLRACVRPMKDAKSGNRSPSLRYGRFDGKDWLAGKLEFCVMLKSPSPYVRAAKVNLGSGQRQVFSSPRCRPVDEDTAPDNLASPKKARYR